jgi:hypothetical protein
MDQELNGKLEETFQVNINVVTEDEAPISYEPQITNEYKRGEFIETWNKYYFMSDLSNVEEIIEKFEPEFYGLGIFSSKTNIESVTIDFTGQTGMSTIDIGVKDANLITFIDGGKNYTYDGVRTEGEVYGWEPRSNSELYTYVGRSDVDAFDYPSFSVRGTRKIPATTADTLCGPENVSANKSFYNWYFGENAGIDFNPILSGGNPTAISGSVNTLEGASTMSDDNGSLLFYSDGVTVYDSGSTVMTNGTGLLGSSSSTQTCLIVQRPTTNKYFIFTTSITDGLKYSVVDMDLNQVISKNNSLLLSTEKVAATNHNNGTDYWVLSHTTGTTNFSARQVSSVGIGSAVNTFIGSTHNTGIGNLKISPNSSKVACAIYDEDIIDLFDFDNSSGLLSNFLTITGFTYINGPYGVEFSSDSSKLYATDGASTKVYQFDLTYTATTDMVDNAIEVGNVSGGNLGSIQMAPDEKIYVADLDEPYLHVIHDSNKLGVECSFQENDFILSGVSSGNTSQWGLPNVVSNNNFSCDRYVYLSERTRGNFNFDVVFDNLSDVIGIKELNYQARVYRYDNTNSGFTEQTSFISANIPYSSITNNTYTLVIPFSGITEGEYIIKGFYDYKINTLLSKQLGYTNNTIKNTLNTDVYGLYDSEKDWYFVNVYEVDKPDLRRNGTTTETGANIVGFNVKSLYTTSGLTTYGFNIGSADAIGIVSLNGSVLAKNIEYTATTSSGITLGVEVLENQILTVVYTSLSTPSSPLFNDSHFQVGAINSGGTDTELSTDKVFYNTEQSKYEYYIDTEPQNNAISLIVNGSQLATGVEFYRSNTNSRRIILEVNLKDGDIVQAIYVPKTGLVGVIGTNKPVFSWAIGNPPTPPITGDFTVEVVDIDDEDFDTILYSVVVPYTDDVSSYIAQIELTSAIAGDQFLYRIKNEKRYTPISGEIITDVIYSDVNSLELGTNAGNSY